MFSLLHTFENGGLLINFHVQIEARVELIRFKHKSIREVLSWISNEFSAGKEK
jgi:hypothetical protein